MSSEIYTLAYRLRALASSSLYFFTNSSSLSLQALPLRTTGLSGIEKFLLNSFAIMSQSLVFSGRLDTTSLAREMSCCSSGHLKFGMLDSTLQTLMKK